MTRVDFGWVAAVALIVWPLAYSALHAIRRGGRALTRTARTHHRRSTR